MKTITRAHKGSYILLIFRLSNTLYNYFENAHQQNYKHFFKTPISRADLVYNCAFCDKSMKLGIQFLHIIVIILRNGATSDLTFSDL